MAVEVIDKIKPKNGGSFPIVEAVDVAVTDEVRLPEALAAKANTADVASTIDNLQAQVDQIAQSAGAGTADTEIAQARVDANGVTHETLKARIDSDVTEINDTLGTVESAYFYPVTTETYSGVVYDSNGTIAKSASGDWRSVVVDVAENDAIKIVTDIYGTSYYGVIFADNSGNVISKAYIAGAAQIKNIAVVVSAPEGATKLYVNKRSSSSYPDVTIAGISKSPEYAQLSAEITEIAELEDTIETISEDVSNIELAYLYDIAAEQYAGVIYDDNGTIASNPNGSWRSVIADVKANDVVNIITDMYGVSYYCVLFADNNGNVISKEYVAGESTVIPLNVIISVPQGATKLYVNRRSTDTYPQIRMAGVKYSPEYSELDERIDTTERLCSFSEVTYTSGDYGINGTVGNVIHNTGSVAYKHAVLTVKAGDKVRIYVDQTTSTTYPYYGMFTDAANKIIAVFAPTPAAEGAYYYEAVAPEGVTYLYVNTHITGSFKIKIYKYAVSGIGEINTNYDAIEFPAATVGGIKGTIGNQIETTVTSSYSYTKIGVSAGQMYRVQTEMTDSTQYPYYVYFTTSDNTIVNYGLPKTGQVEVVTGYATVPAGAVYMYVLCRGASLPAVSIELVIEKSLQEQINEITYGDTLGLELLDTARNTVFNYNLTHKFVNFAFITDVHVNGTYASTPVDAKPNIELFNTVCNEKWLDFGSFGGDLYSAYGLTMEQAIKTFDKATQMFGNCEIPLLMTKGNHECNAKDFTAVTDTSSLDWDNVTYYIYQYTIDGFQSITETQYDRYDPKPTLYVADESTAEECITKTQWYLMCQNRLADNTNIVWNSGDRFGGYFYKDFSAEGVRVIVLNYYDMHNLEESGVHGTQLKWLAETALMTDKTVVIMAHNHGNASMIQVISAFVNGTSISITSQGVSISADYTELGAGKLAGYIHGDDHVDNYSNSNGYNIIGTTRGFAYPAELGTTNQYAFDIFTVDTHSRKIRATRVGRGDSRSWSY